MESQAVISIRHFVTSVDKILCRFWIPEEIRSAVGWTIDCTIGLMIFDAQRQCKYKGILHAGRTGEICDPKLSGNIHPGEQIHVYVFKPTPHAISAFESSTKRWHAHCPQKRAMDLECSLALAVSSECSDDPYDARQFLGEPIAGPHQLSS